MTTNIHSPKCEAISVVPIGLTVIFSIAVSLGDPNRRLRVAGCTDTSYCCENQGPASSGLESKDKNVNYHMSVTDDLKIHHVDRDTSLRHNL